MDHAAVWNSAEAYLPIALKLLEALLLIAIGFRLLRWFSRGTERLLVRRNIDQLLAEFLRTALMSVGLVVLILAALQTVGIPTTSFLAVLGTAGLAIGLALKDSLAHLAAGVMLMVLRPFRAGDSVRAAGQDGAIIHVGLFQTVLRTADNRLVTLPNGAITSQPIINLSSCDTRRSEIVLTLALDASLERTIALVRAGLDSEARINKEPAPSILVTGVSDRGAALQVQYWTVPSAMDAVRSDLLIRWCRELPEAGSVLVGPGGATPLPSAPAAKTE